MDAASADLYCLKHFCVYIIQSRPPDLFYFVIHNKNDNEMTTFENFEKNNDHILNDMYLRDIDYLQIVAIELRDPKRDHPEVFNQSFQADHNLSLQYLKQLLPLAKDCEIVLDIEPLKCVSKIYKLLMEADNTKSLKLVWRGAYDQDVVDFYWKALTFKKDRRLEFFGGWGQHKIGDKLAEAISSGRRSNFLARQYSALNVNYPTPDLLHMDASILKAIFKRWIDTSGSEELFFRMPYFDTHHNAVSLVKEFLALFPMMLVFTENCIQKGEDRYTWKMESGQELFMTCYFGRYGIISKYYCKDSCTIRVCTENLLFL